MHFHLTTALLVTSSLLVSAVPYKPRDGMLQRQRRRLVDYPVEHVRPVRADMPVVLNKRSTPTYSVVQVDGSSAATTSSSAAETILATVTAPAITLPQATETLLYTTTAFVSGTPQTQTILVTPTTSSSTSTSTSFSSPTTTAAPDIETIYRTVAAPSPSSSSTQYYDDGMWHTFYPVKTAWDWSSWKTEATSATAAASAPTATAARWTRLARGSELSKRRVPANVQVANWELTRTEEIGAARFR